MYKRQAAAERACARQHKIRGRAVQPRLAARQPKFRKLFVGGLDTRVGDAEFLLFFEGFGEVVGSQVVQDRLTGASRGFGFITFADPAVAMHVLSLGERSPKIRVNAVSPGAIETPSTAFITQNETMLKNTTKWIPLKRLGQPEDIALGALYLASSASSFVSGKILEIDGGMQALPGSAIQSVIDSEEE